MADARAAEPDAEEVNYGPFFSRVGMTLDIGTRVEAAGPFFYSEKTERYESFGYPPFYSRRYDYSADKVTVDILWKLAEFDRMGSEYRFAIVQLFSFTGGRTLSQENDNKFTLFPFYFRNRSANPERDYTAVFPFYGHIHSRMFRDEIKWIMAPLYVQTRKRDIVTDNYLLPFVHKRTGNNLSGWQVWPLVGEEYKGISEVTNVLGEVVYIPPHYKSFFLWPIFMESRLAIGTEEEDWQQTALPFYYLRRSKGRDVTTALWPFFSYTDDRDKGYKEWGMPYPVFVMSRGPGKEGIRVWPIYGQVHNDTIKTRFVLSPLYRYREVNSENLHRERVQIAYFFYDQVDELNTETGKAYKRRNQLPLFTYEQNMDGTESLQIFAPLEPVLPNSDTIRRTLSPLWSLWRMEHNPNTGHKTRSLLWNLYRQEKTPETRNSSFLMGLFRYESGEEGKSMRLFYLPKIRWGKPAAEKPALEKKGTTGS